MVAVPLLAHLSELNPAVAMPLLRRTLLSLQKELCTTDWGGASASSSRRRKEEAAQMLQVAPPLITTASKCPTTCRRVRQVLERHVPQLIRLYCPQLLSTLLSLIRLIAHATSSAALMVSGVPDGAVCLGLLPSRCSRLSLQLAMVQINLIPIRCFFDSSRWPNFLTLSVRNSIRMPRSCCAFSYRSTCDSLSLARSNRIRCSFFDMAGAANSRFAAKTTLCPYGP